MSSVVRVLLSNSSFVKQSKKYITSTCLACHSIDMKILVACHKKSIYTRQYKNKMYRFISWLFSSIPSIIFLGTFNQFSGGHCNNHNRARRYSQVYFKPASSTAGISYLARESPELSMGSILSVFKLLI